MITKLVQNSHCPHCSRLVPVVNGRYVKHSRCKGSGTLFGVGLKENTPIPPVGDTQPTWGEASCEGAVHEVLYDAQFGGPQLAEEAMDARTAAQMDEAEGGIANVGLYGRE